ncbi:MAG TPA: AMP-binding protein [Microthrixaceae bacterium]|nr:AMP-binding protein [Microthrixaceae bacterium]
MAELIALDVHGGEQFLESLTRIWDRGDAVMPLDLAGPRSHVESMLEAMRPAGLIDANGELQKLDGGVPVEDGDATVITTSGTTGVPKGAVHTHEAVRAAGRITTAASRPGDSDTWLACLPLSHVGGFSVTTRALTTGAGLIIHDGFDAAAVDSAASAGATHVSLVPTVLPRIDAGPWTTILLGGSQIPSTRPHNSIATYGMTETFGGVIYDGFPLSDVELRVDADSMIEIRSPTLLRAYRSNSDPEGTDPLSPEGWYKTGDLGEIDPSTGLLSVSGRADDLIITGGEKVWPGPVEEVILLDPRVRECLVTSRPDPEWGQRVVAMVIPSDPRTPPKLKDLRWLVRERLPVAAAPKELLIVDALARTSLGKLRRGDTLGLGDRPPGE